MFIGPTRVSTQTALNRFSCYFEQYARVANAQTDTQTTVRVTSVAVGHICAAHAMWHNSASKTYGLRDI